MYFAQRPERLIYLRLKLTEFQVSEEFNMGPYGTFSGNPNLGSS